MSSPAPSRSGVVKEDVSSRPAASTLAALATEIERAKAGSSALDEAIFEIVRGRKRHRSTFEQYEPSERLPAYTTSLDAALSLVPEDHLWGVHRGYDDVGTPRDQSFERFSACVFSAGEAERGWDWAPTPALALCIAALKARAVASAASIGEADDSSSPSGSLKDGT